MTDQSPNDQFHTVTYVQCANDEDAEQLYACFASCHTAPKGLMGRLVGALCGGRA